MSIAGSHQARAFVHYNAPGPGTYNEVDSTKTKRTKAAVTAFSKGERGAAVIAPSMPQVADKHLDTPGPTGYFTEDSRSSTGTQAGEWT
jgi:hypothetical protein